MDANETIEVKTPETKIKLEEASPGNGLAGLRQWRHDIPAALVVALVSVPLSLGIAISSKAPPICGLTSEIIAGLIFPFLGGAYVTVCGPAAGLAPILATQITTLGKGDLTAGYHAVLCVIAMVGVVELVLTWLKAAKFSQLFPISAIHGMLASIGLMLFSNNMARFVGSPFHSKDFFSVMAETPSELQNHVQPAVFSIGVICLMILFTMSSAKRSGLLKHVPPQLVAVVVGAVLASLFHLEPKYLVEVPRDVLQHGIVCPDFKEFFTAVAVLPQIVVFVLTLTFVDGTESLATIQAVDRIDPFHRQSSADKTLFAMGISNICSSLIGGLTIIPGIIKSTTNIVSGGRTAWVNFYNALFLILFLLVAGDLIRMIPLAALAAVLIHIGYKLAGWHKWTAMHKLGIAQLLIFALTILVTLQTDLMCGIGAGMVLKAFVLAFYAIKAKSDGNWLTGLKALLGKPLEKQQTEDDVMHVYFRGSLTCFNCLGVRNVLSSVPTGVKKLVLHFNRSVLLVDHSTNVYLESLRENWKRAGKVVEFDGLDDFTPCGSDAASLKYRVS
jgi:carbonic anhydrase